MEHTKKIEALVAANEIEAEKKQNIFFNLERFVLILNEKCMYFTHCASFFIIRTMAARHEEARSFQKCLENDRITFTQV